MDSILVVLSGVLGLAIGSFLNVVIWRVPRGESLVRPASHCPRCDAPVRAYDNIPVVSWLVLRGRCRDCGNPIAWRYPAVELGTGLVFAGVALWSLLARAPQLGSAAWLVELLAYLVLAACSIALGAIDIELHRLPTVIIRFALVTISVLLLVVAGIEQDWFGILRMAIGGVALFLLYGIIWFIAPNGMGMGDVRLAPVLGVALAWIGWGPLVAGVFAPFLIGGLLAVALVIARRAGRKSRIPFGPAMLGGAWIGIVGGQSIVVGYLALFGITA